MLQRLEDWIAIRTWQWAGLPMPLAAYQRRMARTGLRAARAFDRLARAATAAGQSVDELAKA